jgi:hypothetical protein
VVSAVFSRSRARNGNNDRRFVFHDPSLCAWVQKYHSTFPWVPHLIEAGGEQGLRGVRDVAAAEASLVEACILVAQSGAPAHHIHTDTTSLKIYHPLTHQVAIC